MSREPAALHVGWHSLHPDPSLNFQLNRWAAYGGPQWLDEVRPVLPRLRDYESWRETFLALGDTAEAKGRSFAAALHVRCAEFFMVPGDPRKAPARRRFLALTHEAWPLPEASRQEIDMSGVRLPVIRLGRGGPHGVLVVFGGFDSYIEEFVPILLELARRGFDVVAFEGPGQGAVLEEQGVPMTAAWHRPVGAVLDALALDDVTLVGISLGGGLAIRAAAKEPRVQRVVAFDVLADFRACLLGQVPRSRRPVAQVLSAGRATGRLFDAMVRAVALHQPVVEWGIGQAMHVFGKPTPHEALAAARELSTTEISRDVRQDVLLLFGEDDHYVGRSQLDQQLGALRRARSVTARIFSRAEQAQAHCQVGNLPLAIDVIELWLETLRRRDALERTRERAAPKA